MRRTGRPGRGLARPLVADGEAHAPTTWDEAVDLGSRVVKAVIERWGADAVGMKFFDHGGGGGGFENNWAVGRFFFSGVGTRMASIHNRPAYNSEVHASADAGVAALSSAYVDAELADTILVVGANPYETQTNYFLAHMVPEPGRLQHGAEARHLRRRARGAGAHDHRRSEAHDDRGYGRGGGGPRSDPAPANRARAPTLRS